MKKRNFDFSRIGIALCNLQKIFLTYKPENEQNILTDHRTGMYHILNLLLMSWFRFYLRYKYVFSL